jgi:List-Bact-rpt repeat protein
VKVRKLAAGLVLFACVFVGGFFAVGALGRASADMPTIVIDRSIGGISIDMSHADVVATYGAPDDSLEIVLRGGGTGTLVHYHLHGGVLIVVYAGGRVVSIETDASFYRTQAGIGPGTSKGGLHGFHQDPCSLGLWDGSAAIPPDGVVTVFQRRGDLVASVTITQLGYYDLCASAGVDQEVPDPRPSVIRLSVAIDPDGSGWVRSSPYLLDCPEKCSVSFDRDTEVRLDAHPTLGFTFEGWSGACSGTGPCVVTMDAETRVTAHFSGRFVPVPAPPTEQKGTSTDDGTI